MRHKNPQNVASMLSHVYDYLQLKIKQYTDNNLINTMNEVNMSQDFLARGALNHGEMVDANNTLLGNF